MIVCCQAAAIRFLRQPKKPKKPRADSRSGRAAGSGTGDVANPHSWPLIAARSEEEANKLLNEPTLFSS